MSDFSFTRDREDAGAVQEFLNPLPRSVVRPNEYVLLDGEWRFELDLDDRGLREQWYLGHTFSGTAHWPASIEEHLVSARHAQEQTPRSQDSVIAWYEREFTVPEEWLDAAECEVQITFGAWGYETRVWLDGRLLRPMEGEDVHFGEHTTFSDEVAP